ncbi:hypothetical protein ROP_29070 [Rhodococcus opacus B4]|uniref:diacylglycerol O-acyltransferase n=1 Tax=Rhodococcus opacus (strain B4) TaxID=632772 RepID=C1B5M8_RHOOB|nr:hypothetical protein ROP_29070 [Rhodococcus opacus B4]
MGSLGQWGWESDTRIDLGHHVRHDALAEPGEEAQLLALCSRLHSTPLDRSRPLWEIHLIEGLRDGRYATYTKIHHAVADGVSAMTMVRRALSENPDERACARRGSTLARAARQQGGPRALEHAAGS